MRLKFKHLRKVIKDHPDITEPKILVDLAIQKYNLDGIITKKYRTTLRKMIWDLLNRKFEPGANPKNYNKSVKILVFDIETAPLKSYVWRRWGQNIYSDQSIDDDWPILTWSAKWLFEKEIFSDKMTPEEALMRDDHRVVKSLWEKINEADIVIAHNGLKFDMRMMNARFWLNEMKPYSSVQVIDTLRHARRALALPSYKLDDLARYLGKEGKIKTDFTWWSEFMEGNPEAIDRMHIYNDKDVEVLEEVYLSLRPWIKPHPNLGLFIGDDISTCPTCNFDEFEYLDKYATYVNLFDELRCKNCGSISRSRQSGNTRERKNLRVSLPK